MKNSVREFFQWQKAPMRPSGVNFQCKSHICMTTLRRRSLSSSCPRQLAWCMFIRAVNLVNKVISKAPFAFALLVIIGSLLLSAMKTALALVSDKAMSHLGASAHLPKLQYCNQLEVSAENNDFLECWARAAAGSLHHPVGTAAMGDSSDPSAVIDGHFRYGSSFSCTVERRCRVTCLNYLYLIVHEQSQTIFM